MHSTIKCQVLDGGGEILSTEEPHFTRKENCRRMAFRCQVKVKQNMVIQVPEEVFVSKMGSDSCVRKWNVASFIKEFVVEIPEARIMRQVVTSRLKFRRREVKYSDIDIMPILKNTLVSQISLGN